MPCVSYSSSVFVDVSLHQMLAAAEILSLILYSSLSTYHTLLCTSYHSAEFESAEPVQSRAGREGGIQTPASAGRYIHGRKTLHHAPI